MNKTTFVWVIAGFLILSACSGGAAGPTTEIDVNLMDFKFEPSTFTVPAGQEITLNATNPGAVVHSFVIMKQGQSAGTEFTEEDRPNVYWDVEVEAGGSINTSFLAPEEPGEYEVVCLTPGHLQAGMVGKLSVVAGE